MWREIPSIFNPSAPHAEQAGASRDNSLSEPLSSPGTGRSGRASERRLDLILEEGRGELDTEDE